jgi:hypothetical protein
VIAVDGSPYGAVSCVEGCHLARRSRSPHKPPYVDAFLGALVSSRFPQGIPRAILVHESLKMALGNSEADDVGLGRYLARKKLELTVPSRVSVLGRDQSVDQSVVLASTGHRLLDEMYRDCPAATGHDRESEPSGSPISQGKTAGIRSHFGTTRTFVEYSRGRRFKSCPHNKREMARSIDRAISLSREEAPRPNSATGLGRRGHTVRYALRSCPTLHISTPQLRGRQRVPRSTPCPPKCRLVGELRAPILFESRANLVP